MLTGSTCGYGPSASPLSKLQPHIIRVGSCTDRLRAPQASSSDFNQIWSLIIPMKLHMSVEDRQLPLSNFPSSQLAHRLTSPIHPFARARATCRRDSSRLSHKPPTPSPHSAAHPLANLVWLQLVENGAKSLHVMTEYARSLAIPLVSLHTKLKWERSPLKPTKPPLICSLNHMIFARCMHWQGS